MLLRRLLLSAALLTGAGCQSVGGGLAQNAFDRASSVNPNLGCTRAPCVLPNSQASATAKKPVNETAIAADPRNPQHITVEANDYNCPTGAYGASASFSSDDGGATWTSTCFAVVPNSKPRNDPDVAYDLNGTVYRAGLDVYHVARRTSSAGVAFDGSRDNGKTWGSPIIAVPPQKYRSFLMEADKPWMAIDTTPSSPHRDAIYIVTNFNYFTSTSPLYSLIGIAHSDDHGKTWTTVHVGGVDRSPVIDYTTDLAIAADGTVYLSWFRCHKFSLSSGCSGPVDILLVKSSDGGSTWSKPVLVHRVRFTPVPCSPFGCLPNTKEGVLNIPVIASDNSAGPYAGSLYECDNTFTAGHLSVQVTRSADGGATWSAPVPVAGPGVRNDEFFQWCSVSKDGTLGVTWLDRRNDPANVTYEAFGAYSKDGGATFSTNYQLAARPSNPKHDGFGGTFMGDYTGNTWAGEKLYAAWQDTSNGHTSRAIVGGLRIP